MTAGLWIMILNATFFPPLLSGPAPLYGKTDDQVTSTPGLAVVIRRILLCLMPDPFSAM